MDMATNSSKVTTSIKDMVTSSNKVTTSIKDMNNSKVTDKVSKYTEVIK